MRPSRAIRLAQPALSENAGAEWLLTNSLGGFALGSAACTPDRRYHAWLIAATRPPLGRIVALHSAAEWLVVESRSPDGREELRRFDLSTFRFRDGTLSPSGHVSLAAFEKTPFSVRWSYRLAELGGVEVQRELSLVHGLNACAVRYTVGPIAGRAWLEIRPFTPLREFHSLATSGDARAYSRASPAPDSVTVGSSGVAVSLQVSGSHFADDPQVWQQFAYRRDQDRCQDYLEDLYSPGVLVAELSGATPRRPVVLRAWQHPSIASPPWPGPDTFEAIADSQQSRVRTFTESALARVAPNPVDATDRADVESLVRAADQFVVRREGAGRSDPGRPGCSTIAGYPWFSDWGRDTMISLPGLLLVCGRADEARRTLEAFASLRKNGLIPNCFDDAAGTAKHNTADASLWFIHAACAYLRETGDRAGFAPLRAACFEIVEAYRRGTDYGIRVDADGLVCAGNARTQLTWMDACREGVVFTPRHGKPVEISALWYGALLELAAAVEPDLPRAAREFTQLSTLTAESFTRSFWNERDACLFDCLVPEAGKWTPDASIRPNQVLAASLAHSPLSPEHRRRMLTTVGKTLLTPLGLRTLAPGSPGYRPRYEGSLMDRDGAYHNGTVWPWLIGPYCEAILRTESFSDVARTRVLGLLGPLRRELRAEERAHGSPLGTLPEVYDADETSERPRHADGCPAQAWSVGEVLRVLLLALAPAPRGHGTTHAPG